MRVPLSSLIVAVVFSAFLTGPSVGQPPPPKPTEPKPKGGQPKILKPAEKKPADALVLHAVIVPAYMEPVYCCPPPRRCGFLARLFGRCCEPCCCDPCPTCPSCGCVLVFYMAPEAAYRIRLELNPQPLPPRGDAPKKLPKAITPERTSASLYQEAVTFYWNGDAATSLKLISAAVERDSQDAATWYFKALAERSLGDLAAAQESARRGAALELLNRVGSSQLGLALERVQGADRQFLRSAMTPDLSYEKAQQIAAAPVKNGRVIATK